MKWLKIAVVGGVNLDIIGFPKGEFRSGDSLIGRIRFSCGGVGHNIAAQAVKTGADVSLFTVFGDDHNAAWLKEACLNEGIRVDRALQRHEASPTYMAIHGADGNMLYAVNDMKLLDCLTPDVIDVFMPDIGGMDVCVADTNLPEPSLARLAQQMNVPLVIDPVSVEKARRVLPVLPLVTALKPNLLEAQAMTGEDTPERCAERLLRQGLKMAFISLGSAGVYYADADNSGYLRPPAVTTSSQNGAGDALTAGIASGVGLGLNALECARRGMDTAAAYLHTHM